MKQIFIKLRRENKESIQKFSEKLFTFFFPQAWLDFLSTLITFTSQLFLNVCHLKYYDIGKTFCQHFSSKFYLYYVTHEISTYSQHFKLKL